MPSTVTSRFPITAILDGLDLYAPGGMPFTYTPFAAFLFTPLAAIGLGIGATVWTAISIFCLEIAVWRSLAWIQVPEGPPRLALTAAICCVAFSLDPVSLTLLLGQINLVLMAGVLVDLSLPDSHRWKGALIGVAAGIKLVPAFFIVYLLVTRRFRAAAVAAAFAAASAAVGLIASPASTVRYWGGLFIASNRVGDPQNVRSQSLQSLFTRWSHGANVEPALAIAILVVAAVALYFALRAHRGGDELLAVCMCGLATNLMTPITWQHHWVWLVPVLIWLAGRAFRSRSAPLGVLAVVVALEFFARPYQWVTIDKAKDLHLGTWPLLLSSTYAVTAVVLLVVLAAQLAPTSHQTRTPPLATGGRPRTSDR